MLHRPFPIVVGCIRSGTTLLRAMLDAHPEMAVPPESSFIAALHRHYQDEPVDPGRFVDDLLALDRIPTWELDEQGLRTRLTAAPNLDFADAVRLVHQQYAEQHGKTRYGHKTPVLVRRIPLLLSLLPEAVVVHLIRDPRDVAMAITAADFGPTSLHAAASMWRARVRAGMEAGRPTPQRYVEISYERLVEDPDTVMRDLCGRIALDHDAAMLAPERNADAMIVGTRSPGSHGSLRQPISMGLRNWRRTLSTADVARVEAIVGDTLVAAGYESHRPEPSVWVRLAAARTRIAFRVRRRYRRFSRRTLLRGGRRPRDPAGRRPE